MGAFMKFMFGLVYSEEIVTPFDWLSAVTGGFSIWFVNMISDNVSDMYQTDLGVQFGVDVYPGDSTCRSSYDHPIFHEMNANGLLELVMVADAVNEVIRKGMVRE